MSLLSTSAVLPPPLSAWVDAHAGPVAEQVLLLENIGTSVLVGPEQLSSLHRLLLTAASTLQMAPPDLYIKQVRHHTLPTIDTWHHSHNAQLTC